MGRPVSFAIQRQLLESRRDTLARDLRGWRARRPLAEQTHRLEVQLRAVDLALDKLERQIYRTNFQ